MSAGIPVVASPVGVNTEIVVDGKNCLLARGRQEWIDKLSLLVHSAALRRTLALEGRRTVEERYSTSLWSPRLARIIRSVAEEEDKVVS